MHFIKTLEGENRLMNMYKNIFNKIYGLSIDKLDESEVKQIRESVISLRNSYQSNIPITNYKDENIRKAYMLCYYINYIYPAYKITKDYILDDLLSQNRKKYRISYFGAGPAPEVYGSLKAFSEFGFNTRLEINILDLEMDWLREREITFQLINELETIKLSPINSISRCDLKLDCRRNCISFKECKESVLNSDVLFMQNTINHLGNNKYFIDGLKQKITNLNDNSFFVIIDLDYAVVKDIIHQIIDYSRNFAKLIASNIDAVASEFFTKEPVPPELTTLIFTGESGLILKKKTRYYYAVIQICKEVQL